jgi:hypothetical protein
MPGAKNIQVDEQAQEELKALAASRTSAVRLWERATIIMELAAGTAKQEICQATGACPADCAALGTAISAAGDGWTERRAAIGSAAHHRAREDRADRTENDPRNSCRFHALEHTEFGCGDGCERLFDQSDLEGTEVTAASGKDIQVE